MGIISRMKSAVAKNRIDDEIHYANALREYQTGTRRDGLWAKALIESDRSRRDPNVIYLELRVKSLRDEHSVAGTTANELARTQSESSALQRRMETESQERVNREYDQIEERLRAEAYLERLRSTPDRSNFITYAVVFAFLVFLIWFHLFK